MPVFVASGRIGSGQTAVTTDATLSLSGTGAVAGQLLLVFLDSSDSTNTVIAGPSAIKGPNVNSTNSATWVLGKLLTAADITAGSVTITLNNSSRVAGLFRLWSGAGVPSSAQVSVSTSETTATSSPTLPTLGGVASGSAVEAAFLRRRSGSASTTTVPTPYTTPASGHVGTSYATGVNVFVDAGYIASSSGGTVGGESGSTGATAVGNNYVVEVPSGTLTSSPADTVSLTDVVTGTQNAERDPADSLGITDAVSAVITLIGSGADPVGLTDAASTTASNARTTADAVSLSDSASAVIVGASITPETSTSWPPPPYRDAQRFGGVDFTYLIDASLGGVPVAGATGMTPIGGSVTDTTKPGVRRVLNLDLAPNPGLYDLLKPIGTRLAVTARATYQNYSTFDIPMGVFDVDSEKLTEGFGSISLTAPDKWAVIQRAKFIKPQASAKGQLVTTQIATLIQGALGASEPVFVTATSTARVGALTWDTDREKAILDLAASIGVWVFFDRYGTATIADIPVIGSTADWLLDSSASGVLINLDREVSRTSTYNVVVVHSSAASGAAFTPQYVWDNDPSSPTYAGPDPVNHPELAGPFGVVTYAYDTPILKTAADAVKAGRTILARTTGLASQISAGVVPNPAMDAFAVLDVLPPKQRYDIPRTLERHVADTLTHPLAVDQPLSIQGRSTRIDEYVG